MAAALVFSAQLASPALAAPPAPTQLPTGGQVVAGTASLAQSGNTLAITQSSNRAAIDWNTFNIGSQAKVQFNQPSASSVTLNRVQSSTPSQIFGQLSANGQVFLSNPSGVYFAPGASVDVGALVATTHSISNADFMAGSSRFNRDGATGSVLNEGDLRAGLGGYIALLAPEVRNQGVVVAQMGTVALAAGESYELQFDGTRLTSILVTPSNIAALVDNAQAVQAPGGLIILSAQAANRLQAGVVNNSGTLEASGMVDNGGTIRLAASDRISQNGTIHADAAPGHAGNGGNITVIADLGNPDSVMSASGSISARGGDAGGNGGFIETSGTSVKIGESARFDTHASQGNAGTWLIDPKDFTVAAANTGTITTGTPSGDVSGAVISAALANGNVTIASGLGSTTAGSGDVNVNDAVNWTKNTLTLTAARNININAVLKAGAVNDTGSAGTYALLAMNPATTNNGDSAVTTGLVNVGRGLNAFTGRVDFVKADGTTPRGGTGLLSIGGAAYTVITSLGASGSTTGLDLQGMTTTANYALGANIDGSASAGWTNKFSPVGNYSGNFNGLGHVISNLTVKGTALFTSLNSASSIISNMGMVNGSVTSTTSYTGSVVGWIFGTLSNVFNSGMSVSSTTTYTGGLTGWASGGQIINSFSDANVSGNFWVGGLVGFSNDGSIQKSFATGTVTNRSTYTGGLVGYFSGACTVSNSYAIANVSGANYVGGFLGGDVSRGSVTNSYSAGTVTTTASSPSIGAFVGSTVAGTYTNNFYDSSLTGALTGGSAGAITGVRPMATANMKVQANFTSATAANGNVNPSWDFSSIWTINPAINNGYPYLATNPPCQTCNASPITINLGNTTKVYGDNNPSLPSYTVSGTLLSGDSLSLLNWGSAALQYLDVGSYAYSLPNLLTPSFTYGSGHSASNYIVSWSNNALTITPRPITVTATALSKVYGSSDPALAYTLTSGSLVNGNTLTGALQRTAGNNVGNYAINKNTLAASSNYTLTYVPASRNAGTNIALNLNSASTLQVRNGGRAVYGYRIGSITNPTGTINKAPLTMIANAAAKVVFDTDPSFSVHYTGFVGGETEAVLVQPAVTRPRVGLDEGAGTYANALVPSASSSNYTITPVAASFTISPIGELLIRIANTNNMYGDALPGLFALDARYCPLTGCVGATSLRTVPLIRTTGNSYTFNDGFGTTGGFDISTAATSATPVGTVPITLSNFTSSIPTNFRTQSIVNGALTITPRLVALSSSSSASKVYDGALLLPTATLSLSNKVGTDTITVSGTALLSNKNAGVNKVYTFSNLSLAGADAGNYYLGTDTFSANNATVTQRVLDFTAAANDKIYDGTTLATLRLVNDNRVPGDLLGLAGTATFANANAGSAIAINPGSYTLTGTDAGNYLPVGSLQSTTAAITPRPLTMVGAAVADKVYDGTTVTSATAGELAGLVGADTLLASVRYAQFNDAHAATNKPVTLVIALADGAGLASNYSLSDASSSATIRPRPVDVVANAQSKSPGQADPALSYETEAASSNRGLVDGDALNGTLVRDPGENTGAYRINQGSLTSARNPDYAIHFQSAQLTIQGGTPIPAAPLLPEGTGRTTAATDRQLTEAGILVSLERRPAAQVDGLIVVEIPRRLIDAGKSLSFPLPVSLAEKTPPNAQMHITTVDGREMPDWLRYEPSSKRFVAERIPPGGLPLQLVLECAGERWTVLVTEYKGGAYSGAVALLELLATATKTHIVAPGQRLLVHGFHARADIAPEFAQIVYRPYRIGKGIEAVHADGGHALVIEHGQGGLVLIVFGQRHHALQGIVQPFAGFLVARWLPFVGPVFHGVHEAHSPDLGE